MKQTAVVLNSDDNKWRTENANCCKKYPETLKESDAANIFFSRSANETGTAEIGPSAEFDGVQVPDDVQHNTGNWKDILNLRNQGFEVDNDSDPVEDNTPDPSADVGDKRAYKDWGWNEIDPRKIDGSDMNEQNKNKNKNKNNRFTTIHFY